MTDDEIRVKIAEACWWDDLRSELDDRAQFRVSTRGGFVYVGDPLNDLNACHEMEKALTYDQSWVYDRLLSEILGTGGGIVTCVVPEWSWHATARQRAEAFLKTINVEPT